MTVKLNAATGGGSVSLSAPNSTTSNADVTLTLPPNDGDASQYLQTDGAGALSWQTITDDAGAEWTSGTSATLSGSNSTTFSGLPSNVQQVTMTLSGVSWVSGAAPMSFRLGSGGSDKTSGYTSHQIYLIGGSNPTDNNSSSAFELSTWTSANHSVDGHVTFTNHTGNEWVCVGVFGTGQDDSHHLVTGRVTLDGALDRVTVRNVSNNFDAGSANVHYITT